MMLSWLRKTPLYDPSAFAQSVCIPELGESMPQGNQWKAVKMANKRDEQLESWMLEEVQAN